MNDGWYLLRGDIQYGPFTFAQILECIATQKITRTDYVRREGVDAGWEPAGLFPELFYDAPGANRVERPPVMYGGFGPRLLAKFVDNLILFFAWMAIAVVVQLAFSIEGGPFMGIISVSIYIVGSWLYSALLTSSFNQGTVGKQMMSIQVTDLSGKRISFGRATSRHFAEYLSSLIMIGQIMAAMNEKEQALHDMMAGTLVVKKQTYY
jgi:uncharacterized RDD family membrane protein YckC